ncbi:MAG: hypothetical protein P8099_21370 [Gemmatimonadota bacterium]
MNEFTIEWTNLYGARHLVVVTPAGRWVKCGLTAVSATPGAPCPACLAAFQGLAETITEE